MSPKYVVNGKEYDRLEDMPPEVRSIYQSLSGLLVDADHNGIPDIMEGKGSTLNVSTSNLAINIVHDGKVYTNEADLPSDVREKYEKAMQSLGGAGGLAVFNAGTVLANTANAYGAHILENPRKVPVPAAADASAPQPAKAPSSPVTTISYSAAPKEADVNGRSLMVAALLMLLLAAVVVIAGIVLLSQGR